jgi:hypothetical protein
MIIGVIIIIILYLLLLIIKICDCIRSRRNRQEMSNDRKKTPETFKMNWLSMKE